MIKSVRSEKKHPVILIQKLLLNFQTGGKQLSVFFNKNNPLAIEITNKFHPNFQIPLPEQTFDVEEHWKFKIKKIDLETKKSDKIFMNTVDLITQLTHLLRSVNGADCFGDLRLDFSIDCTGKCWLINACSNDYLEFSPLDGFEESPYKTRYLSEMKKMQKPVHV